MEKLRKELKMQKPSFLRQLKVFELPNKAKRYKITMAASMAV